MEAYDEQIMRLKYEEYTLKKKLKQTRYNRNGTTANKDSSRTKVYKVEWEFEKLLKDNCDWRTFSDLEECQKYINQVTKTKKWKGVNKELSNRISADQMKNMKFGTTSGQAWYGKMTLSPRTGFNQYVILHELAHCAGNMHHDISFRQCLVELVSCFIGRQYGLTLKKMFKQAGLKMNLNTKILTFEKWKENYIKMESIRAK
jgi:hypothetical protein